jgi:putative tricarboxylic transport membrane protein
MHPDQFTVIDEAPPTTPVNAPATGRGFWAGRSNLVVAALILTLALYLTAGVLTMEIPEGAKTPGPTFFPIILAICAYVLAALLSVQALRTPEVPETDQEQIEVSGRTHRTHSDWKALGTTLAAFLTFSLLLMPVGWILSAALLFWLISWALGSKRPLFDVGLSLVFASAIQVAFSAGLGLNLPPGLMEGIL